ERGVEAHAELADQARIGLLLLAHGLEEAAGAGAGDAADVGDHFVAVHADAGVAEGDGAGVLVPADVDVQRAVAGQQLRLRDGFEAQLVAGVGGVGDQLAQEDLLVRVQRMRDQMQDLGDFGFELAGFGGGGHVGSLGLPEADRRYARDAREFKRPGLDGPRRARDVPCWRAGDARGERGMRGSRSVRWGIALPLGLLLAGMALAATPKIGGPAPVDLLGTTPEGEAIRISEHRGKVVVVSFWASWCGYCRKQFPFLDHLQTTVGSDDLRVVVVNFQEPAHEYRSIRRTLRKSSVTWTHGRDGALSDAFGVSSVPNMFIFDRDGNLAGIRRGYSDEGVETTARIITEALLRPATVDAAAAGVTAAAPGTSVP